MSRRHLRRVLLPGTIKVEETTVAKEDALSAADLVISGVPSKSFCIKVPKARAAWPYERV